MGFSMRVFLSLFFFSTVETHTERKRFCMYKRDPHRDFLCVSRAKKRATITVPFPVSILIVPYARLLAETHFVLLLLLSLYTSTSDLICAFLILLIRNFWRWSKSQNTHTPCLKGEKKNDVEPPNGRLTESITSLTSCLPQFFSFSSILCLFFPSSLYLILYVPIDDGIHLFHCYARGNIKGIVRFLKEAKKWTQIF